MIIEIEDLQDYRLDVYARLSERQLYHIYEPDPGIFIAESPKVIERAIDAGYVPLSFLVDFKDIEGEAKDLLSRYEQLPIYTSDYDTLTKLTGFHLTRGLLCAMKRKELPSLKEIIRDCKRIAVLENVNNPTNVGAIIRSAAALNMDAVVLTKDCADPLQRRSARVSMGTVFQIPWTVIDHIDSNTFKDLGFKTVALALEEDSYSIRDDRIHKEEQLAVILGNEGYGLKKETLDLCDYTVYIPMSHGVDSLNVAACSAVAFFELGNK